MTTPCFTIPDTTNSCVTTGHCGYTAGAAGLLTGACLKIALGRASPGAAIAPCALRAARAPSETLLRRRAPAAAVALPRRWLRGRAGGGAGMHRLAYAGGGPARPHGCAPLLARPLRGREGAAGCLLLGALNFVEREVVGGHAGVVLGLEPHHHGVLDAALGARAPGAAGGGRWG
jgi:hypothetical protein